MLIHDIKASRLARDAFTLANLAGQRALDAKRAWEELELEAVLASACARTASREADRSNSLLALLAKKIGRETMAVLWAQVEELRPLADDICKAIEDDSDGLSEGIRSRVALSLLLPLDEKFHQAFNIAVTIRNEGFKIDLFNAVADEETSAIIKGVYEEVYAK